MYVCVKFECRKKRMIQKVFQIQEIFNSLIKCMYPCYRSLMKIHQHGAEIFNKMCSFEVSKEVLPLHFDCLIKRIPVTEVV